MPENILDVNTRGEFRAWLEANHSCQKECYVLCALGKAPADGSLWYYDVVEEALCFGWIDSTLCPIDGAYYRRISPRRKGSHWSELNKERARRMERLGLMTDAGRAVLPDMTTDLRVLFPELFPLIHGRRELWNILKTFPGLYVRVRMDGIGWGPDPDAKAEERLHKFIEYSLKGEMYGNWNDYGRLSE